MLAISHLPPLIYPQTTSVLSVSLEDLLLALNTKFKDYAWGDGIAWTSERAILCCSLTEGGA